MIKITAPAKINLTLEVLSQRPDGYHEIRSVMQAVGLGDTLTFKEADETYIQSDMPGWSAAKSLVSRAVALVKEKTGVTKGVVIKIDKKIPISAGLGGDSSDAAAALKGLNGLWELGLSTKSLVEMAAQLGSDVGFFLEGGTALAASRGEILTTLPPLPEMWLVLVLPDVPVEPGKTARMYRSLTVSHYTDGKITERLVELLKTGGEFNPSLLFNTFENVAFQDKTLRTYKEHLLKLGASHIHLCGSGPALFTLLDNQAQAGELYNRCQAQEMTAYLAQTL